MHCIKKKNQKSTSSLAARFAPLRIRSSSEAARLRSRAVGAPRRDPAERAEAKKGGDDEEPLDLSSIAADSVCKASLLPCAASELSPAVISPGSVREGGVLFLVASGKHQRKKARRESFRKREKRNKGKKLSVFALLFFFSLSALLSLTFFDFSQNRKEIDAFSSLFFLFKKHGRRPAQRG